MESMSARQTAQKPEANDIKSNRHPTKKDHEIVVLEKVKMNPQNFSEYFFINRASDYIEICPKKKSVGHGLDFPIVYSLNGKIKNTWIEDKPIHLDAWKLGLKGNLYAINIKIREC